MIPGNITSLLLTPVSQAVSELVGGQATYEASFSLTTDSTRTGNNVFVDSSTNALSVTRLGNPLQGTVSPFSPAGWSGTFDGVSDTVYFPSKAEFAIPGGSAFTVEAWVNMDTIATTQRIFCMGRYGADDLMLVANGNVLRVVANTSFGFDYTVPSNFAGAWHHLAVVRTVAGIITLYVDGVAASVSTAYTAGVASGAFSIGGITSWYAAFNYKGKISNMRYVVGTAVYTANFTPPTEKLTAIPGTVLLTLQSSRIVDASVNKFTPSLTGVPKVSFTSPFTSGAAYSPALHGGSMYFDGAGDYATVPNTAAVQLTSAGSFTMELWCYLTSSKAAMLLTGYSEGGPYNGWALVYNRSGANGNFEFYDGASWNSFGAGYTTNQWHHIAVVNNGGAGGLYIDGVRAATFNVSANINNTTVPMAIGRLNNSAAFDTAGYLSDVHLTNNAKYSGTSYAVPTAPVSATAATRLLLSGTNATIYDATTKTDIELVGDVQASTAVTKFAASSVKFDGTGDYLRIPYSADFDVGAGNFTIECWFNLADITGQKTLFAFDADYRLGVFIEGNRPCFFASSGGGSWDMASGTNGNLLGQGAPTVVANTWHHFALVRNSNIWTMYIDGVLNRQSTIPGAVVTRVEPFNIGRWGNNALWMNGYIEDFKFTKGIAKYTAPFTPPTA